MSEFLEAESDSFDSGVAGGRGGKGATSTRLTWRPIDPSFSSDFAGEVNCVSPSPLSWRRAVGELASSDFSSKVANAPSQAPAITGGAAWPPACGRALSSPCARIVREVAAGAATTEFMKALGSQRTAVIPVSTDGRMAVIVAASLASCRDQALPVDEVAASGMSHFLRSREEKRLRIGKT